MLKQVVFKIVEFMDRIIELKHILNCIIISVIKVQLAA